MNCSELASNEEAWQETRDEPGMAPLAFPSDEMVWGTATTQDSSSWNDMNQDGTGMALSVVAGYKYVVVAVPKKKEKKGNAIGNMASICGFGMPGRESRPPSSICDTLWDHEGVLLGPGDTL
jgi:hypothetical protein